MVTEKDIINMGRKIKRSNNPKTLARYQAQIDAWISELEADQARTQAEILALKSKIKMEEEARAAQISNLKQGDKIPVSAPESPTGEKIKMEEEAKAHQGARTDLGDPKSPMLESKKIAGPRKSYHYFEFERLHLRRSRF